LGAWRDVGIEIVKTVVGHPTTASLSGNAYKVLVCMATTALDKAKDGRPAGLYFGGWDALAITLGYPDAEHESKGKTAVKRAIQELRKAGHITAMVTARTGSRQSYLVHPGGLTVGITERSPQGISTRSPQGSESDPHRGSPGDPPRTNTGTRSGLNEDKQLPVLPQPQTADPDNDPGLIGHKFEGTPGVECLRCDRAAADRTAHPIHLAYSRGAS
jgi:hypothetical protein